VSPAGKRRAVGHLLEERRYAERNACRLVEQPRSTQRYKARIDYEERRIRQRLHELAKKHPGSGYRRMAKLLRREGLKVNRKRVQRLWREEGLRNPLRKRQKRARGHSENSCAVKKAEFADREIFGSLLEAKVLGAEYQRYWNQERLHRGIGYRWPAEFAAELGPDSATLRPPQVRAHTNRLS
jgi:transposase InsO family protein